MSQGLDYLGSGFLDSAGAGYRLELTDPLRGLGPLDEDIIMSTKDRDRSRVARPKADRGRAFVIMPFTTVGDLVYSRVVVPLLTIAGYTVKRADTDLNQRAIMQDVITGIETADLIVADLTGRNANVFYELGIAHRGRRPSILLAQSSGDIPFDLGAYRALIYRIEIQPKPLRVVETLSGQLRNLLEAIGRDEIIFANPFSDYIEGEPESAPEAVPTEGVIDLLADFQNTMPRYIQGVEQVTANVRDLTQKLTELTEDHSNRAAEARDLASTLLYASRVAKVMDAASDKLETIVEQLESMGLSIEKGVLALIRAALLSDDLGQLEKARASVTQVAAVSETARASVAAAAAVVRKNAQWANSLRQPSERLASFYDRYGAVYSRTAALPAAVEKLVQLHEAISAD